MNILLIVYDNSSYIATFPLGTAYIASVLKKEKHKVTIYNQDVHHYPEEHLTWYLDNNNFDIVGLGMCGGYYQYRRLLKISEAINKSKNRNKFLYVIGGHMVSPEPEYFLAKTKANIAVCGEGEKPILAIASGSYPETIRGLMVGVKIDVNSIPFPAWDLFPMTYYRLIREPNCNKNDFVGTVITSRGCIYNCNFCLARNTKILTENLIWKNIQDIKVGDTIIGFEKGNLIKKTKVNFIFKRKKMVYEIKTNKGIIYATDEHPFLNNLGKWISIKDFYKKNSMKIKSLRAKIRFLSFPTTFKENKNYKKGYIAGILKGDGTIGEGYYKDRNSYSKQRWISLRMIDKEPINRYINYLNDFKIKINLKFAYQVYKNKKWWCYRAETRDKKIIEKIKKVIKFKINKDFIKGYFAGLFDAEGSHNSALRIHSNDENFRDWLIYLGKKIGFNFINEKKGIRLIGGIEKKIEFLSLINPTITRKKNYLFQKNTRLLNAEIISITPLKRQTVYNLETDCHTFWANGFASHNCYRMVKGIRLRNVQSIIDEIKLLQKNYGITYINFSDELTMSSKARMYELCNAILKNNLKIKWRCEGRLNYADKDILTIMKKAGCVFVNYGIESLDNQVLKNMNKNLTVDQIYKGIENTLKIGISPGLNIIWGNIGDNAQTLKKSVDFLLKYDDCAQLRTIRPVTPYPGSPLYYYAIEKGLLKGIKDFYENKHVNSDLLCVNFTDIPDDRFHYLLCQANIKLLRNYYSKHLTKSIETAIKLYQEKDVNFRGFRQS